MYNWIIPEPPATEDKPAWDKVPEAIVEDIETLAGARVAKASSLRGGFSPSAGFLLTLADGRKIVAKGSHPDDMSHATKNIRQECDVYLELSPHVSFMPRHLGMVTDSDEDGWTLGLWEYLDLSTVTPGVDALEQTLQMIGNAKTAIREDAFRHNFLGHILSADKKWKRLAAEEKIRARFTGLFKNPAAAEMWLNENLPVLLSLQERAAELQSLPRVLLHGDLRLDNILHLRNGDTAVVDWPNAAMGPRYFDRVFLSAHVAGAGVAGADTLWHGAARAPDFAVTAALLAGYFADQAYRDVPPRLPRLRWMQKTMLYGLLRVLESTANLPPAPDFAP